MMRALSARRTHRRRSPRVRFGRTVLAVAICLSGLVLAAAFLPITMQANAIARESAGYRADIGAAEAEHVARTAQIATQRTADYVTQKARDFGFIGPNESLISIQRDGQASDTLSRAVGEGPSRIARWAAFFFGTR